MAPGKDLRGRAGSDWRMGVLKHPDPSLDRTERLPYTLLVTITEPRTHVTNCGKFLRIHSEVWLASQSKLSGGTSVHSDRRRMPK